MRTTIMALVALGLLSACASPGEREVTSAVSELHGWMTGTFSSAAQSAEDPENFFPIRLVTVPVWTDRADGPWLYVEQAAESRLEQPYRQRVYHLVDDRNGVIRSEVYTLPRNPLSFAGCWKNENPLGELTPDDLKLRTGCTIHLTRVDETSFAGSTQGKGCRSSLAGAAYATSEVTISDGLLTSWDRGYDLAGNQVWGAEKGPYRFVRSSPEAP